MISTDPDPGRTSPAAAVTAFGAILLVPTIRLLICACSIRALMIFTTPPSMAKTEYAVVPSDTEN
ncbi:hypothetical protein D3C72_2257930 [compost metagenome]